MAKAARKKSALGRYLDTHTISRLSHLRLKSKDRVYGDLAGDHKSPLLGFAVEFAGHRGYVPGDDIRHIDWNAYYKIGRYYIKQYEAETNLIAHVLVDGSESMLYGDGPAQKMEYAATLAVTLAHLVITKRDKFSFGLFDEKMIEYFPPSQSMLRVQQVDRVLTKHEAKKKTDLGRVLSDVAPRLGRRRVIMVISDFFDDIDSIMKGLERLRYNMHDLVVFHVLHRDELVFPFDGNFRFMGFEGIDNIKTDAQLIRDGYRRTFENYLNDFSRRCETIGADYVLMDTSIPVEVSLAKLLAGRMGTAVGG